MPESATSHEAATGARTVESSSSEHEHEDDGNLQGLSAGLMANAGGTALPSGVRADMEQSFGADFSGVRVHEDDTADQLGAQAVAQGQDLHFADGQFDPDSQSGRELLGHELAHVVQQKNGNEAAQGKGAELDGSPALEQEADVAGARAARGESAMVRGRASAGRQLKPKNPLKAVKKKLNKGDRTFLDAARPARVQEIADGEVEQLKSRLTAKATLRLNKTDDGQLIEDLQKAAENKVKKTASTSATATGQQKADVKAKAAAIARRSDAVKTAVSGKAESLADTMATGRRTAFEDKANNVFTNALVPKLVVSKPLLISTVTMSARSAAASIREAQYQLAKQELDQHLTDEAATIKQDLTTDTRANVADRAEKAVDTRMAKDTAITDIATAARKVPLKQLHATVEDYLVKAIGAKGAAWFRPERVRDFRQSIKDAGREQAEEDIKDEINSRTDLDDATGRWVKADARARGYDKAKDSVNEALTNEARGEARTKIRAHKAKSNVTRAARRAAFSVYEKNQSRGPATAAANVAAQTTAKKLEKDILADAKAWKDELLADPTTSTTAQNQRSRIGGDAKTQVTRDDVGKRSVESAIRASSPDDGMAKVGDLFDFLVPERGNSLKFKVKVQIPFATWGGIILSLEGSAERGVREQIRPPRQPGQPVPPATKDTSSLKVGAEFQVGVAFQGTGFKIPVTIGAFIRADGANTDACMKLLSYGIYRKLTEMRSPMADAWGGDGKKIKKMVDPGDDLNDDTYRAELWAAMVEEQTFMKDDAARVDVGVSGNAGVELNFDVIKAKAGVRGELMRTFDYDALRRGRRLPGGGRGAKNKLGDANFTRSQAAARRSNIRGRTGGAVILEAEGEFNVAGNAIVIGGKLEYEVGGDVAFEFSGGFKMATGDSTDYTTRLVSGLVGTCTNIIQSIAGIARDASENDRKGAGPLGNLSEMLAGNADNFNNISGDYFGQALTNATQVASSSGDQVIGNTGNDIANSGFGHALGMQAGGNSATKPGMASEQMYRLVVSYVPAKQAITVKIEEVQTKKVDVGGFAMDYEKGRRLVQVGSSKEPGQRAHRHLELGGVLVGQ